MMRARSAGSRGFEIRYRRRVVLEDRRDDRYVGVALEWTFAGGHLVQQHADRKDVGTGVDWLALGLFGRHVGDVPMILPSPVSWRVGPR